MPRDQEYGSSFDNVVRSVFLSSPNKEALKKLDNIINDTSFELREILADIALFSANSSHITHIGYNPMYEVLEIKFKNNPNSFRYKGVGQDFWNDFVSAQSFGKYFHKHIKNGGFEFIELPTDVNQVTTNEL